MIRIFFKTLWNNRMRNVLVFIELFIVSLVLVNLTIYFTERARIRGIRNCYDMRNVVSLGLYNKVGDADDQDGPFDERKREIFRNLKLKLKSNELVESVSFAAYATPFYVDLTGCTHKIGNNEVDIEKGYVDFDYAQVMKIKPLKGRWFNEGDRGKAIRSVLISKSIDQKYFKGDAVGKTLSEPEPCRLEIIGVVDEFKRSDYEEPLNMGFVLNEDLTFNRRLEILVRARPGQAENFLKIAENEVMTVLDPNLWGIRSQNSLDNIRSTEKLESLQRRYLGILLAIFVLINVLLGVIGILWYNTNLRVHEIGVKRAMGATGQSIKKHLIFENLLLGGLGLIVVVLVYLQVPSVRITKVGPQVMYLSVIISMVVMILLILLSTWIPATIAARIRPAEALKTE